MEIALNIGPLGRALREQPERREPVVKPSATPWPPAPNERAYQSGDRDLGGDRGQSRLNFGLSYPGSCAACASGWGA